MRNSLLGSEWKKLCAGAIWVCDLSLSWPCPNSPNWYRSVWYFSRNIYAVHFMQGWLPLAPSLVTWLTPISLLPCCLTSHQTTVTMGKNSLQGRCKRPMVKYSCEVVCRALSNHRRDIVHLGDINGSRSHQQTQFGRMTEYQQSNPY